MISEERLRQAAQKAGEALADSLPEPEDCRRQFSPAFERRMKKLLRRSRHPVLYQSMKRAACFLLVCFIGAGAFLGVNAEARDTLFGWVTEQAEGAYTYFFDGPPAKEDEEVHYILPEIPEGYSEYESLDVGAENHPLYVNDEGYFLGFGYLMRDTESSTSNISFWTDGMEKTQGSVHGSPADIYIDETGEVGNVIVWTDEETDVLLYISGYFNAAELTDMAESVIQEK